MPSIVDLRAHPSFRERQLSNAVDGVLQMIAAEPGLRSVGLVGDTTNLATIAVGVANAVLASGLDTSVKQQLLLRFRPGLRDLSDEAGRAGVVHAHVQQLLDFVHLITETRSAAEASAARLADLAALARLTHLNALVEDD